MSTSTRSNKIVLSVDDMPEVLLGIKAALRGHYKVFGVTNAEDALDFIGKQNPHLFVLDIEMPYIDGYDLASIIRMDKRHKATPIIFLTGHSTRGHVLSSMQAGGNDFIIKPINHSLFLAKVIAFLEKK